MELAAALHHSAAPETNDAVRSPKTVSSRGVRPGVLQDPAPQLVSEHAARAPVGFLLSVRRLWQMRRVTLSTPPRFASSLPPL